MSVRSVPLVLTRSWTTSVRIAVVACAETHQAIEELERRQLP